MTLEDFFTLTEMKDGLTALSRVEELVNVMQKEKDCVVKNVSDTTRQWAAVASTIAATENEDCLDRFVQLDGLWYVDRWLKDAQNFGNDTSDSFVEESITALLRALEKLHIDYERSISSGIWVTVKNLLGHNSTRIQDGAKALFDGWKQGRSSDTAHHKVECAGASGDVSVLASESSKPECVAERSASEGNHAKEPARPEILLPSNLQPEKAEDVQIQSQNNQLHRHMNVDHGIMEDTPPGVVTSVMSNSGQEKFSMEEDSTINTVDGTAIAVTGSFPDPGQGKVEGQLDGPKLNELSNAEKEVQKLNSYPEKMAVLASASSALDHGAVSFGADAATAQVGVMEPTSEKNADTHEDDHRPAESSAPGDVKALVSEPKSGTDDRWTTSRCTTQVFKTIGQDGECVPDGLSNPSSSDCRFENPDNLDTSFSRMKDVEVADEDKEHTSDEEENFTKVSDFSKSTTGTQSPSVIDKRRSDMELEYGIVDALEVARQVAQEVEREVVDYRERSCSSSSGKMSEGGIRRPASPDSIDGKQDLPTKVPMKEVPTGRNYSAEAYSEGEGHTINSDNLDAEPENAIHDLDSSQVTEAAQEPEMSKERGLCDFDLNQEVCSDDVERPPNPLSAPSVVSASRPPAAATGWPTAPPQFEGPSGWKGSAATSAFRPASPRRISDGEKTLSTGGTSNSSKQRQDCLDIDLNVAEGGDDRVGDIIAGKQVPVSSGPHSGESSLDVSPRRSERLKLDLNRISDEGDAPPSDLRMEGQLFFHRNRHRSPSPASSSSSMQPSMRNFDLNDRPIFHSESLDQGPYQSKTSQNVSAYGGSKADEPVISIMGAKVEVRGKDFFPQAPSLANGKALEPATDANVTKTGSVLGLGPTVSYTQSPVFGYNGLTTAPSLSFSPAMCGPGGSIPYMVDSRGAPVVPQILGSASAVPSYTQPPFILSMTGAPPALNGAGPSRPSFDLNSGFAIDGGNRDLGGLRQLFTPGQGRSMEEHLRTNLQQPSSSGVGGKRKEPDGGWDSYPFSYRHQPPPWR